MGWNGTDSNDCCNITSGKVQPCGTQSPTQSEGSTTSTEAVADAIGYIPSLAYSNVFSIFYLEIISITKLISGKNKSDSYIGIAVNCAIFVFYFILFLSILLFQLIADPK